MKLAVEPTQAEFVAEWTGSEPPVGPGLNVEPSQLPQAQSVGLSAPSK